jgi:glycosyltransferase-like protein
VTGAGLAAGRVTECGRIAMLTYSTKPRGGVVHTLSLAEALAASGVDVEVFALGSEAFYRPVSVPHTLFPAPEGCATLEEKVFASVDEMARGLAKIAGDFDLFHAQDCMSARAAARVRDESGGPPVVRTVHHVDDFTTSALVDCQRKAILEPDHLLVVSRQWQAILRDDYGVEADIVPNGVDVTRLAGTRDDALRAGFSGRFVFLAVGGVEPRKGSTTLFAALGLLAARGLRPALVILGGQSFQDYEPYRREALAMLPALGLEPGTDVVQVGTVTDAELAAWYRTADALAFPSLKEGFGLVALEALACDLPVVASDLPAFGEFLTDGQDALLPAAGDPVALADAMERVMTDPALRSALVTGGRAVVPRFTWEASAARHIELYRSARPR